MRIITVMYLFSHLIGFLLGCSSVMLFLELCNLDTCQEKNDSLIKVEEANIVVYSAASCRCCKDAHDILKNANGVIFVDLSLNIADAVSSSIIMHAKNPKKMREHIFKNQKMWLNENDILLSSRRLIDLCREIESIDLQKVYSKVSILMEKTRKLCSSLGHDSLPTVFLIKKWEGLEGAYSVLREISKSEKVQFGSLNVE